MEPAAAEDTIIASSSSSYTSSEILDGLTLTIVRRVLSTHNGEKPVAFGSSSRG